MCTNTFMRMNTRSDVTRRKIAKLSNVEFFFPTRWGGSCSINKSIFSPIQGYLVSNRFTILRSPPARPIYDGDIMSRLREINLLDFPLIETPRRKRCATFSRGVVAIFGNEDIDFVFIYANEFIPPSRDKESLYPLFTWIK